MVTIGAFARASGLTASALRFYADSGLLPPAIVDPVSGYRYYADDQLERAVAIRGLREIGMPLDTIAAVLAAGDESAGQLIDEHVAGLEQQVRRAREGQPRSRRRSAPGAGGRSRRSVVPSSRRRSSRYSPRPCTSRSIPS